MNIMKYIPFLICFFSLCIQGCVTTQRGNEELHSRDTISLECIEKTVADTTFLYAPRVIHLETKENALIVRINRIIEWKQTFYVLDKAAKQIVAFDTNGKHKLTIHRVGNGPEEYRYLYDVAIDKRNDQLVLLTDPSSLLRYDLNGNFINRKKLPAYYRSLAIDGEYIYLENETFANNQLSKESITVLHNDGETELLEPLKEIAPYCFIEGNQLNSTSPCLFTRKFDNTIYKLERGKIKSSYTIDLKEETFPEEAKERQYECRDLNRFTFENNYVYTMVDIAETPEHLLFKTNLIGDLYVLHKSDNKLCKYGRIFQSDYQFHLHKYIPIEGEKGNVCFASSAATLISLRSLIKEYPKIKAQTPDKMLKLLESVNAEDNPILFYYKVK